MEIKRKPFFNYMRNLFFIVFFIASSSCYGQETLQGAWTIKFGTDISEAVKILKAKTGKDPILFDEQRVITYSNVKLGNHTADRITMLFDDGKFYFMRAQFTPLNNNEIFILYNDLKSDIIQKYSEPEEDFQEYKYPYKKGDGDEINALKSDNAVISANWTFPRKQESTSLSVNEIITLSVNSKLIVNLFYVDQKKFRNVQEKKKQNTKNDF